LARKTHLSIEPIIDDSVMNPDTTVPRTPTGNPVAIHLEQTRERLEKHQENERKRVAIDDVGITGKEGK